MTSLGQRQTWWWNCIMLYNPFTLVSWPFTFSGYFCKFPYKYLRERSSPCSILLSKLNFSCGRLLTCSKLFYLCNCLCSGDHHYVLTIIWTGHACVNTTSGMTTDLMLCNTAPELGISFKTLPILCTDDHNLAIQPYTHLKHKEIVTIIIYKICRL